MAGNQRRIFFLAAETTAGLSLNHANLFFRQAEQFDKRLVNVIWALHRSPNRTPASGLAIAIAPLFSIYSCSWAPVSYSPSTMKSAFDQASSMFPLSTKNFLKTLFSPQIISFCASESFREKIGGISS